MQYDADTQNFAVDTDSASTDNERSASPRPLNITRPNQPRLIQAHWKDGMTHGPAHPRPNKATNVFAVAHAVAREERQARNGHAGGVLWFTGLSGSGKSTLAMGVERELFSLGYHVYVLDGDNVRHGLNTDLGFSADDRTENIRRIGEVAALFAHAGILCLTAFISPFQADRDRARKAAGASFQEIHIKANLDICEKRDPKGLYAKARRGAIKDFTGIDSPYEPPTNPDLVVDTGEESVTQSVERIVRFVESRFLIAPKNEQGGDD